MKNVRIILFSSCKPGILPQSIRRPKVRQARLRKLPGNRPQRFSQVRLRLKGTNISLFFTILAL
jgi:hypothetical protein